MCIRDSLWIEGCFCFFVYGNPMLENVYKKIPAISADIKAKEKSPNANCVQAQPGLC